ncbi:MAG: hypothetical protein CFE21_11070 [Bacteroidetes bacterium B1(2017)]|nr:MAG: hypothetical protein CFE21_11070 [Bacteroidetes bacterium B1(2017)]
MELPVPNKIFLLSLLMLGSIWSGCTKAPIGTETVTPKCVPDKLPSQYKAVFIDDVLPNASSQSPVAVFKFNQTLNTYANTSCKTKPNECETRLYIQNISGYNMRMSYSINYLQGSNAWTADGFADIPTDSVYDAGVVNCNCGWVSSGSMIVMKKGVTYKN